jgi:hypothetical protein
MNKEISVLKKLGIVAATATAGMLALSPLAFASGKGHDNGYDRDSYRYDGRTVVRVVDNSVERNQDNACSFDQDAISTAGAIVGVLGGTISQAQNGNCVNLGDDVEAGD